MMNNFFKKSKIIYIFAFLAFAFSYPSTYVEAQSSDKPRVKLQKKWLKFMKLLK